MIASGTVLSDQVRIRPLGDSDAGPLLEAYVSNREHLRPWDLDRAEDFFTFEVQESRVRSQLKLQEAGRLLPWVLATGDRIVGAVTLSDIALGPARSANLGYWIDEGHTGQGLATLAVEYVCRIADEEVDLHRIEAATSADNVGSRRVLAKSGFTLIGTAHSYLHINGAWRDHMIFQRILNDRLAV
ncbi:GNAT family N-acetyltransferase [Actinospica sp. MGRD01-02]|uniref:GNAT family N-acetyltransferase n=1 Tax=Actinospica acidithermotolerans TaxID=2828514 RepID=A0A941IJW6_9ACTN|nr:GNAT family protein [Actinospica acidithermotolerans]MBR7828312.1 GNAT family N-acetyltransferase [Actinospica acidithermotolerans]